MKKLARRVPQCADKSPIPHFWKMPVSPNILPLWLHVQDSRISPTPPAGITSAWSVCGKGVFWHDCFRVPFPCVSFYATPDFQVLINTLILSPTAKVLSLSCYLQRNGHSLFYFPKHTSAAVHTAVPSYLWEVHPRTPSGYQKPWEYRTLYVLCFPLYTQAYDQV